MKKNIYIINNLELKRDANILKIEDTKIPISMIANVFIFSNAKITRSAKNLLLRNKRSIFYFNKKYELTGILSPPCFNNYVNRRIKQYQNINNLEIAKEIVKIKLNTINKIFDVNIPENNFEEVVSYKELLGIEGFSSNLMFQKFKKILNGLNIKEFKKREYRPVKDKINGLLSFLYTLYYSFVYGELVSLGFDPYVGFLHRKKGDHAVLCSDVMEEARVVLTFLCIEILKEIYNDGFENIYLTKESRKFVISKFDEFLLNYENSILKYLITVF